MWSSYYDGHLQRLVNQGSEKFNNLHKTTWLESGRAGNQTYDLFPE